MLIYFLQDFYDEIADQIFKLREQREKCTVNTAARDAQIARINERVGKNEDFVNEYERSFLNELGLESEFFEPN